MDNASTEKVLRALFQKFYEELEKAGILVLGSIKITTDLGSGEVTISDEEETVTADDVIYAWGASQDESGDETKAKQKSDEIREYLRRLVEALAHEGYFEGQIFQTPFAVLYSDLRTDKAKPIYKIDGGWTVMDKPILKGWEKEMNAFLSKLLDEPAPHKNADK